MKQKQVWVKADEGSWDDRLPLVTAAIESGVDYVLVDHEDVERVRELGDVGVAAFVDDAAVDDDGRPAPDVAVVGKHGEGDGSIELPEGDSADVETLRRLDGATDAAYVRVRGKEYEEFAARVGREADYVVVVAEDWQIIPLENLIADLQGEDTAIVAGVDSSEDAVTAFETMEHGADAVLLDTDDAGEIKRTVEARDEHESEEIDLVEAEVTRVEQAEMGDRVCVDTASLMEHGEGMLVGSMSNGLFLVHAETAESPYVASRPFRVNAGAVHAYIRVPGGGTRYLSELEAGDDVLIVDSDGGTREALVGRSKIEKRPLMLVEAEVEGERYRTLLQNAETIKLVTPDGPRAVTDIEEGDRVLIYVEDVGRHFGMEVEESVVEK
ncbi:MAG: 3-dehydroquinate synthase II [Halobacteriales archaeon]